MYFCQHAAVFDLVHKGGRVSGVSLRTGVLPYSWNPNMGPCERSGQYRTLWQGRLNACGSRTLRTRICRTIRPYPFSWQSQKMGAKDSKHFVLGEN